MKDKSIDELIDILETSTDTFRRSQVAARLGEIATGDDRAIFALVNFMKTTTDEWTRRQAAESLGEIGLGNETAISALVNLLETTTDEDTRSQAAESLGEIGLGNKTAISALVNLIETTADAYTIIIVVSCLAKIGKGDNTAIFQLVRLLERSNSNYTQLQTAYCLGKIGKDNLNAISEELVRIITKTSNEWKRWQALECLGEIGKGNEKAISALVNLLETTTDDLTRSRIAKSLGEIGRGDETAISALVELLDNTNYKFIRLIVAQSLEQIATGKENSILELINLIAITNDTLVNRLASENLWKLCRVNQKAITALCQLSKKSVDQETQIQISKSVEAIGKSNQIANSFLINQLQLNTNLPKQNIYLILELLAQIERDTQTAVSALVTILVNATDDYTAWQALYSLNKFYIRNEREISALLNLIENMNDQQIHRQALESLSQIASGVRNISPLVKLQESTTDDYTRRQISTITRSNQVYITNQRIISVLVNLIESTNDEWIRWQAATTVCTIDPRNERAISELANLVETSNYESIRGQALESLRQIGIDNEKVISALVNLFEITTEDNIRRRVRENLNQICRISPNLSSKQQPIALLPPSHSEKKQRYNIFPITVLRWLKAEIWKLLTAIYSEIFNLRKNYTKIQDIKIFIRLLKYSKDEFIQWKSIKQLELIAFNNKKAILALIDILKTSQNQLIQWQALKSLGNIGKNSQKASYALVKFLNATPNELMQWQSLKQLQNIGRINLGTVMKIRKNLRANNSAAINSAIFDIQKTLNPLSQLILKFFKSKVIKGGVSQSSMKPILCDSLVSYLEKMQEGRDIASRRSLMIGCLQIYQETVKFSLQNYDYIRTFFYTEIFKNRYLVERIAQQDAPLPATISKQLAQDIYTAKQRERQTLQAYMDGMNQHLHEHLPEVELAALSFDWENAKKTVETLYQQVAEIEPEFIAKTKISPISFQEVQDLLPSDTAIIEFFFTENELITLLILPGHESPLIPEQLRVNLKPQNPLERLARDWEEDLKDKSKSKNDAIQTTREELPRRIDHLGELLKFSELEKYLPRQIKQLIIVPNNSLHLFPIHAVPLNPTQRLIDRFSVRYFPNLQIWKICQNRQRSRDSFLGIENPTEDKDLIFAKAEIASICQRPNFREKYKVLPRPNAQVKKSEILEEAKNYHCFHFSGHAEYNFKNPLDSYLMLSKDREDHQEDLTLSNLFADLHLPEADLVTLSACCTGVVDAFQPTDECLGIATGFLLAGAKAVVSSLWKVNSIATAFLLDEFYRQLDQTSDKAVALQNAQNWLRTRTADELRNRANDWDLSKLEPKEQFRLERALKRLQGISFENPYFWAAFIVTGV